MRKIAHFYLLILLFLLQASCSSSERKELPVPPTDLLGNPGKIALGYGLFNAHCAECHGSLAEGRIQRMTRLNPPPPDFHEKRYRSALPGYLYLRIELGREMEPFRSRGSVMPPWRPHLTQEQIWSLVAFIRYRAGAEP